jgi:low affinity Fe/Cu permease
MDRFFTWFAGRISSFAGQPVAFVIAFGLILIWGVTGPVFGYSDTWQLVINTATTIVTFLMVFLIQNSQNRDAAAMQAKLDELLRAVGKARGAFIGIEHLTDAEIEKIRDALERETGNRKEDVKGSKRGGADDSVDRLLDRF